MRAQLEVVTQATNKKLISLPAGDFEETDSQLEEFTSKFEEVGTSSAIVAQMTWGGTSAATTPTW